MKSSQEQRQRKEDKCTVCLERTPNCSLDGCAHTFCQRCIQKWSRTRNTCPLCRNTFTQLRSRNRVIQVEAPQVPVRVQRAPSTRLPVAQSVGSVIYVPMVIYPQVSNFYYQANGNFFVSGNGMGFSFCSPTFFIPSI